MSRTRCTAPRWDRGPTRTVATAPSRAFNRLRRLNAREGAVATVLVGPRSHRGAVQRVRDIRQPARDNAAGGLDLHHERRVAALAEVEARDAVAEMFEHVHGLVDALVVAGYAGRGFHP